MTHTWGNPNDQRNFAWRDYGLRVGFRNILTVLDGLGLACCHLLEQHRLRPCPPHRDGPRVWFTTPGAIAEHVMSLPPGIVPGSAR